MGNGLHRGIDLRRLRLGVTGILDLHPAHHLPNDDLDVLVVDRHTLETIDLLDLVGQILL